MHKYLGLNMNYFFLLIMLSNLVNAQIIKPIYKFKASGFVNDFVVNKNKLYIATDRGIVDVYDLKSKKIINQIALNPLETGHGKLVDAIISSIDVVDDKVLILSRTMSGYKNVWLYEKHKLRLIIDESKYLAIKEARFIDNEKMMFSTLGADVILHDFSESYNMYRTHISDSSIGDYKLSQDKKTMAMADESGAVTIVNVADSKILKQPTPQNLDNIYHIAYENGVVLTAGQDRRVGVYPKNGSPYYIKTSFLVYCVGLSPSAKVGVYTKGEKNVLQLFNPQTKQNLHSLVGHKGIVNQIKFTKENEFYSSDRGEHVYFWKF